MYTVIQGHIDVTLLPKEMTVKKPHFQAPPPFTKDSILTSLSQLNIPGRMGLASTVQTISVEPPIFTSVGSWRTRMVGASGKGGRNLGKALGPRQATVEKGPRWERYLRGILGSYGYDTVCPLYGALGIVPRISEVVPTLYCVSMVMRAGRVDFQNCMEVGLPQWA